MTATDAIHESAQAAPAARGGALKLFSIGLLTVVMIVPLLMLALLNDERRGRAAEAAQSVAQGWGAEQTVAGPFLVVPWTAPERRDAEGRLLEDARTGLAVLLPETLEAAIDADGEARKRGIFEVPVYAARLSIAGAFDPAAAAEAAPADATFAWDAAWLALGLADTRGLSGDLSIELAGQTLAALRPGTSIQAFPSGVNAKAGAAARPGAALPFAISGGARGLNRLAFVPAGETTRLSIKSDWPHPSFDGAFLPESSTLRPDGFDASWSVSFLARPFPQAWTDGAIGAGDLASSAMGVSFYQPVDHYQLVERALKYAVLFVGLAFLAFFLIEMVAGARIHVVQYLLAGAAQVIFYLLLLALAEQIGFAPAYAVAAAACAILTALYAWAITRRLALGLTVLAALTALYGLLYALLNEEDYALLTGGLAAFAALALTMFLTRRIDWTAEAPSGVRQA